MELADISPSGHHEVTGHIMAVLTKPHTEKIDHRGINRGHSGVIEIDLHPHILEQVPELIKGDKMLERIPIAHDGPEIEFFFQWIEIQGGHGGTPDVDDLTRALHL